MKKLVYLLTFIVCLGAMGFRIWLAVNAKHGDMYNNLDWGNISVDHGFKGFYELPKDIWPHSVANQPPGSIYFHAMSVAMDRTISGLAWQANLKLKAFPSSFIWWWDWNGSLVTIKYWSLIADLAIAAAIVAIAKHLGHGKAGLIAAVLYILNPAMWYNSSFWGQTDPIVAALAMWSVVFLLQKRLVLSPIFLGLSLITKASWAPLVPFYVLYYFRTNRKWLGLIFAPLIMLVLSWPFHPAWDLPIWLFELYSQRILTGETANITVLAFNFWNLVFKPFGVPHTIVVWGLPANIWGWGIVGVLLLPLIWKLIKNPTPKNFLWTGSLLFFTVFMFAPKMLHRYLYPAFPLLVASWAISQKKLLLGLIILVISACYLINIYYLWWAPGNLWLMSWYTEPFTKIISGIYLVMFALLWGVYAL